MRWVAGLAVALLLAGCSTTVPAGPDTTELDAYTERTLEAAWATVPRGGPRPDVPRVRYISNAEYVPVMAQCMNEQGATGDSRAREIAWYVCQAKYPVSPDEYRVLSDAQVDYLYDYYQRWTIPCLASHGRVVTLIARDEFVDRGGLWNPLYSTDEAAEVTDDEYATLNDQCGLDVVSRFPR